MWGSMLLDGCEGRTVVMAITPSPSPLRSFFIRILWSLFKERLRPLTLLLKL